MCVYIYICACNTSMHTAGSCKTDVNVCVYIYICWGGVYYCLYFIICFGEEENQLSRTVALPDKWPLCPRSNNQTWSFVHFSSTGSMLGRTSPRGSSFQPVLRFCVLVRQVCFHAAHLLISDELIRVEWGAHGGLEAMEQPGLRPGNALWDGLSSSFCKKDLVPPRLGIFSVGSWL